MAVFTNVSPYFDDYNEDKNFVRVLFKPGVAVQARELTTAQTILQNQIKSVGNFLFKDGSKVTGPSPSVNLDARTIRLKATDATGEAINVLNLKNTYVTSTATGNASIVGYVEFAYEADDPDIGDPPSVVISLKKFSKSTDGLFEENTELLFYNNYTDALNLVTPNYRAIVATDVVKNAVTTLTRFSTSAILTNPSQIIEVGDLLIHPSLTKNIYVVKVASTTELILSEAPGVQISSENVSYSKKGSCPTSIVTQDDCVFYKFGYFVKALKQRIVPNKNTSYPTKLIALIADQQIITSDDDSTLLDPAVGSSNYFAAGADRLKVNLELTTLDLTSEGTADTTEDVIPLLYYNKGKIEFITEVTVDNTLDRKLAERTYDESGSYVVDLFSVTPGDTDLTSNTMTFSIGAGKAYVGGELVRTIGPTEVVVPKPTTVETRTSYNINTIQGNYLKISGIKNQLIRPQQLTASDNYLEIHSVKNPTSSSTRLGYLVFKDLEFDSYIGTTMVCRLYYRNYIAENEVPATWGNWSTKYSISEADGQYIANMLYTPNTSLGTYTAAELGGGTYLSATATTYYALFREPDTNGTAYWYSRWVALKKDDTALKKEFIASFTDSTKSDFARLRTSSKSYASVNNFSPFYDGLTDISKVKSLVGVTNSYTSQGTSATYASPFFYADIDASGIDTDGDVIVFDQRTNDKLVFDTNKEYVKTIDNIKTEYSFVVRNAIFSSGVFTKTLSAPETFTLGDGSIPASTSRNNFVLLIKSGGTALTPPGLFNFERGTVTISGDSTVLTIDIGDSGFSGIADISIKIQNDDVVPRSKTLVKDAYKVLNIAAADVPYSIKKSDVSNFKGVYDIANADFAGSWTENTSYAAQKYVVKNGTVYKALLSTSNVSVSYSNAWSVVNPISSSNFFLDNGQRDYVYDHAAVTYIGASASIPGECIVFFDYFTHSGNGPATVDSYSVDYTTIPNYTSVTDATRYVLRDSLDFRPRRIDDTDYDNYDPAVYPSSDVTTEIDVTYYLGRKDRIYVVNSLQNFDTPYNKFLVETGVEKTNPTVSIKTDDYSKLGIAVLEIPPYAGSSFDVKVVYEDNKRYTMKDIGKIEDITVRLDKAVKLHSIEIAQLKSTVLNESGDVLLKSGILMESFSDFEKVDLQSGYVSCLIDTLNKTCMPTYEVANMGLTVPTDTDVTVLNDLVTMKFTEEVLISQTEINSWVNVNSGAVNDGRGRATLSKRNSFVVNLLTTGGLLLASTVAAKTAAAYYAVATMSLEGAAAAYAGIDVVNAALLSDNFLFTVTTAAKDVGASVLNTMGGIDTWFKVGSANPSTAASIASTAVSNFDAWAAAARYTGLGAEEITAGSQVWYDVIGEGTAFNTPSITSTVVEFLGADSTLGGIITTAQGYWAASTGAVGGAVSAGLSGLGVGSGVAASIGAVAGPLIVGYAIVKGVEWLTEEICYITTAVCENENKPDNCEDLEVLRYFRDTYMLKTNKGRELVLEYIDTAPILVRKINNHRDKKEIYKVLRENYITPSVNLVKQKKYKEAELKYTDMIYWVKERV